MNSITGLPLLKRKEIFWILKNYCTLSVGDFGCSAGRYWASVGYEALSTGTPVMQSVNFSASDFSHIFGHPPPFFLDVKNERDVERNLVAVYLNQDQYRVESSKNVKWFNDYNGISLAKKWLDIALTLYR